GKLVRVDPFIRPELVVAAALHGADKPTQVHVSLVHRVMGDGVGSVKLLGAVPDGAEMHGERTRRSLLMYGPTASPPPDLVLNLEVHDDRTRRGAHRGVPDNHTQGLITTLTCCSDLRIEHVLLDHVLGLR